MKQIIILILCIFPFMGKANPYNDLGSLREGEWIRFELIGYYPEEGKDTLRNYWEDFNILRLQVRATVLQLTDKTLRMGFQFEYFSDSFVDKENKGGFYYFDSRFAQDLKANNSKIGTQIGQAFNLPSEVYPVEKEYERKTGKVLNEKTIFENSIYNYDRRYVSYGIQNDSSIMVFSMSSNLDIDLFPQSIMGTIIRQWNTDMLPMRTTRHAEGWYPLETRVIDASFELPVNVKLFIKDADTPENNKETSFYCASPQIYDFAGKKWLISPGDSIVLNAKSKTKFSGIGAAKNNFHEVRMCDPNILVPILKKEISVNEGLKRWNEWYDLLFSEYEPELSGFWKKSFQLSRNYYNAELILSQYLLDYQKNKRDGIPTSDMIWAKDVFGTLSPMTDYIFFPNQYGNLLVDFCTYKEMSLMTDNLSALRNNSLTTYNLAKQVLFGYPSYKARAEILIREMTNLLKLSEIDSEYKDFTDNCRFPDLVHEVRQQYDSYKIIEPGEKIQNAGFEWLNEIDFSEKKKDTYTLINISLDTPIDKSVFEYLNKQLEGQSLTNKLTILLYYPDSENRKEKLSNAKNVTYHFLNKEDVYKRLIYRGYMPMTFFVRNDGTILYRSLSLYPFMDFEILNSIVTHIRGNLQKPTAQVGFIYWKEMLLALFVSGLFFFFWARYRQQKERRLRMFAELEQKALRSQMNPHFIFNALGSIQSLILHKQTEEADRYLINFSKLLRQVLQSSQQEFIPLSEELEQIKLYVDLEQFRLPFEIEWIIDEEIDEEMIEIPGMLIQPLVENAIKHGIVPCGGGLLRIVITLEKQMLHIVISDSGNGIDVQKLNYSSGLGVKNIRERIKLYKEKYHINITFALENSQEEGHSGCKADLQIPVE